MSRFRYLFFKFILRKSKGVVIWKESRVGDGSERLRGFGVLGEFY